MVDTDRYEVLELRPTDVWQMPILLQVKVEDTEFTVFAVTVVLAVISTGLWPMAVKMF